MTTDERTEDFATSCESCIFAQWTDGVQLESPGCDLERLDKYIRMGKAHSHENGYYIIDTICNTCRGQTWANQHLGQNLIATVENEIKLTMDFIILSVNESAKDIIKLLPTSLIKCVNQQKIKPKQIIVVIKNNEISSQEVYDILKDVCLDIPYRLVKVLDKNADMLQCLDMGVKKSTSRYYATFDLYHNIPNNLIKTINEIVNYELKSLSMVKPVYDISGLVVQTLLHRIFGGNKELPLVEKIEEAATIQKKLDNIYTWEELWTRHK